MPTPVSVRRITAEDLELFQASDDLPQKDLVHAAFTAQESGTAIFVAAWEGDHPLGITILDLREGELQPQLRNMFVYPHARRRGVGRTLAEFVEEAARKTGFVEVFLAVDPDNEKAIPLYVSLGYSPTGDHLFVDATDEQQLVSTNVASKHWAIYRKSLLAR